MITNQTSRHYAEALPPHAPKPRLSTKWTSLDYGEALRAVAE